MRVCNRQALSNDTHEVRTWLEATFGIITSLAWDSFPSRAISVFYELSYFKTIINRFDCWVTRGGRISFRSTQYTSFRMQTTITISRSLFTNNTSNSRTAATNTLITMRNIWLVSNIKTWQQQQEDTDVDLSPPTCQWPGFDSRPGWA